MKLKVIRVIQYNFNLLNSINLKVFDLLKISKNLN